MSILIDGPSRSGKLLLGKVIMASPDIAFQHYSGDLERLLEALYLNMNNKKIQQEIYELLRLNLTHTIFDLKRLRQLSLNPDDSSYYKLGSFYEENREALETKNYNEFLPLKEKQFMLHSHDCTVFLSFLMTKPEFIKIFGHHFSNIISIVRNPAAQILSWYSRSYTTQWEAANNALTPFRLYKCMYTITSLRESGIIEVPWFINASMNFYVDQGMIAKSILRSITILEVLAISVSYLTENYLKENTLRKDQPSDEDSSSIGGILVYHEHLHDAPIKTIGFLMEELKLNISSNAVNTIALRETSAERFGCLSIASAYSKVASLIKTQEVTNIFHLASEKYNSRLSES